MDEAPLLRAVRPYSSETIGLQLQIDRELIALFRLLLHKPLHTRLDAQLILHMMAKLMRNHIGLRKIARVAAKLL